MNLAARVLAASMWDMYQHPAVLAEAKQELSKRLGENKYQSLMKPDQKPALDYRNPPRTTVMAE